MKKVVKISEAELAKQFIQFFSGGYDVYPEVPAQGIIDIVAVRHPVVIAIECKMQFGFDVLEQAVKNKQFAHYSYIAIPKPKKGLSKLKESVCKHCGVGVLTYSVDEPKGKRKKQSQVVQQLGEDDQLAGRIKEVVRPQLNRKINRPALQPWMKQSIAGSQHQRMTAFKNTVAEIEKLLATKEAIKVDTALRRIKHHYGSLSSAKSSLAGMCKKKVITSFTMSKGYFHLCPQEAQ